MFLQMHGSILPKMILPLFAVGSWATCITCISFYTRVNCECAPLTTKTLAPWQRNPEDANHWPSRLGLLQWASIPSCSRLLVSLSVWAWAFVAPRPMSGMYKTPPRPRMGEELLLTAIQIWRRSAVLGATYSGLPNAWSRVLGPRTRERGRTRGEGCAGQAVCAPQNKNPDVLIPSL